MNKPKFGEMLKAGDSHPIALAFGVRELLGVEWLSWDAKTIWQELSHETGVWPSEDARNKIQAVKTCLVCNRPLTEWNIFELVATSFIGLAPRADIIQRPGSAACALALANIALLRDAPISNEVYRYVAATMADDGLLYGPGPLSPANTYLESLVGVERARLAAAAYESGKDIVSPDLATAVEKARSLATVISNDASYLYDQTVAITEGK